MGQVVLFFFILELIAMKSFYLSTQALFRQKLIKVTFCVKFSLSKTNLSCRYRFSGKVVLHTMHSHSFLISKIAIRWNEKIFVDGYLNISRCPSIAIMRYLPQTNSTSLRSVLDWAINFKNGSKYGLERS